jgi:hypothetical protein
MPSITGWTRLEPQVRSDDMTDALEARVHDPAWFLGRQWQVGEFQGSDNGSPISVRMDATTSTLTRYLPGPLGADSTGDAYDGRTPLETTVEHEPVATATDENLRLAAEAGIRFLSSLAAESESAHDALRASVVDEFALDPSFLFAADLLDVDALAARLSARTDPVSAFIGDSVTDGTRVLLDAHSPGDTGAALRNALVDDLNGLIGTGELYDETRFAGVSLPGDVDELLDRAGDTGLPAHARSELDRRLLAAAYPDSIRAEGDRDPASVRFLRVVGHRVPDGTRLYAALRPTVPADPADDVGLPDSLDVPDEHADAVVGAARAWLGWYEGFFSEPGDGPATWRTSQLEYEFSVAAPTEDGELVLESAEYAGGRLDWYAFSAREDASIGADEDATTADEGPLSTTSATVLPSPVEYRGMPAPRFWEVEERGVRFGSLSAEPSDLPHLLLAEFGLVYGNNWFVVPFELPVGSVSRLTNLSVTDTFGVDRDLSHVGEGSGATDWRLFDLSAPDGTTRRDLFVPPVLVDGAESDPIEEVRFIRDETANMAWGIERTVVGLGGLPVDRAETDHRAAETPDRPVQGAAPRYRLATSVPAHWIPLVAVSDESDRRNRAIRLRRGAVLSTEAGELATSLGRVLESDAEFVVDEEAVPRAGVRLTRTYQYTRGMDGESYLWIGREKRPGRGEGSSGLSFDEIEEGTAD